MKRHLLATLLSSGLLTGGSNIAAAATNTHSIDLETESMQSLSISDASQTGLDITGDMTIELWVNRESDLCSGDFEVALAAKDRKADNQRSFHYRLLCLDSTEQIRLAVNPDGGPATSTTEVFVNASAPVGVWTHLAVAYDASAGSATFYVNGQQQGATQTGLANSMFDGSAPFQIGQEDNLHPFGSTVWEEVLS